MHCAPSSRRCRRAARSGSTSSTPTVTEHYQRVEPWPTTFGEPGLDCSSHVHRQFQEHVIELIVARVGAPRGLKGEVRLEVRTDDPAGRLAPGTVLDTDPADAGPLTVATSSHQGGSWFVRFAEAPDRTAVEALRGILLLAEADDSEDDAWYRHELVGLAVEDTDGSPLGTVSALEHYPAQDVLVITETGGQRTMVPFVEQIVPVVDVAGGRVVLDPPRGLLASDPVEDTDVPDDGDGGA